MSGTAEPIFDYLFVNPTTGGAHSGWRFQAGRFGPVEPYAAGDTLIAMIVARTSQDGDGPEIAVEGISTDGSDWTQDANFTFDNDGSGFSSGPNKEGHYAVAVFSKVWDVADDPVGYEVDFTGIPFTSGSYEGVQITMYLVHGGGTPGFTQHHEDVAVVGVLDDDFARNFGEGHSFEFTEGYADTSTSEDKLYYPGSFWAYYAFDGVTVFLWAVFGVWYFALNSSFNSNRWRFLPAADVDNDLGEGGTSTVSGSLGFDFWTQTMVDVLASPSAVFVSGRRTF